MCQWIIGMTWIWRKQGPAPATPTINTVPDYTVLNRLPAAADVVIPSLSREDEDRKQVLRAIATILLVL